MLLKFSFLFQLMSTPSLYVSAKCEMNLWKWIRAAIFPRILLSSLSCMENPTIPTKLYTACASSIYSMRSLSVCILTVSILPLGFMLERFYTLAVITWSRHRDWDDIFAQTSFFLCFFSPVSLKIAAFWWFLFLLPVPLLLWAYPLPP